jgi:polyisoprenoid-binding protein YceI
MQTRRQIASVTAAVLLSVFAVTASAADQYTLDTAHSSIEFSVKHMLISNVKGTFDEFDATIMYDPDNIGNSSVEVSISVASVNTKDKKRDDHLRSDDFFDAANHPQITFKSKKVEKKGDGYVAVGTLTIRGTSKEVELPFTLNGPINNPWGQTVMGIEIEYELDRQEYGIKWSNKMDNGGLVVGDDVKIEINLEAKKS